MEFIYRLKQMILAAGDMASYLAGLAIALSIRNLSVPSFALIERHLPLFLTVFAFWVVINYINGLYDLVRVRNDLASYRRLFETAAVSLAVGIAFFYLIPERAITPKTILLLTVATGYGASALWRFVYNLAIGHRRFRTNVLFVGFTRETEELITLLDKEPGKGYRVVAVVDGNASREIPKYESVDVYRSAKTIRPAITNHKVQLVVIAPHLKTDSEVLRELYELLFWPVSMMDLSTFYELVTGRIPESTFSETWFLEHFRNTEHPLYDKFRALVDMVSGVMLGVVFLALLPLIGLGIMLTSPGPIFFRQKRIGRFGKEFTLYKFRSMYALSKDGSAELEGAQFAKKKDMRVTPIGKLLRKTRLDEMPQVINLLKRDITLIGPRPERPEIVYCKECYQSEIA